MASIRSLLVLAAGLGAVTAQCPYGHSNQASNVGGPLEKRAEDAGPSAMGTDDFLSKFTVMDNSKHYLTTDAGGPMEDQNSLKAGESGPTLLEDFIFRQKIQHFDHERVGC